MPDATEHRPDRARPARRFGNAKLAVAIIVAVALVALSFFDDVEAAVMVSSALILYTAIDILRLGVRRRNRILVAMGVYSLFAGTGVFLAHNVHPDPIVLWIVAGLTAASAAVALVFAAIAGLREKELDRLIFSNASAIAFFAMMLVALTYALLDNWLRVPALSPWWIVGTGALTWVAVFIGLQRRYS
jgi:hypothetical protein